MNEPEWILRETVLALQEQSLALFGGLGGIRDEGMLDSALQRPVNLFAYGQPDVFELASAYAFGLAKNHPFFDGNKRIAFITAIVFLELNGKHFHASEPDAVIRTLALAAGEMGEADYAQWLRDHSSPQP
ncbi:MAG TPA: type II toxin-antitoxin system death-on-curing family toxin [Rariglobus sp.]